MKDIRLVAIDYQNSFCDPAGELFVQGADADAARVAAFIGAFGDRFTDIHATLDSHRLFDIAHPMFWKDADGNAPAPFTIITNADVQGGTYRAAIPGLQAWASHYTKALEDNGRYPLCIWPPHCLIGTPGHNVVEPVREAFAKWERDNVAMVDYVTKGSNYRTEHYSAVQADVPDPADPTTVLNMDLISALQKADEVVFTGEALSHCVANTVRDIAAKFGPEACGRMTLLTDTMSNVTGFEQMGTDFLNDMAALGVRTSTTTTWTP